MKRVSLLLLTLCLATIGTLQAQNRGLDPATEIGVELGNYYALLFATDEYEHWGDLKNPIHDARTLGEELAENYGFEVDLVENATLETVLSKIREYATKTYQPNDHLLIFFAGHGKYDEVDGEGYLVTTESRLDDETNLSYFPYSQLRTRVNSIPNRHILLALDACFGGTFDPGMRGGNDPYASVTRDEFLERKFRYQTRRYVTSGGKEYVPDGRPGYHSPFMRQWLEALRSYGGSDGILTLAEMQSYLDYVEPLPINGRFGDNEPGSDFLFIVRNQKSAPDVVAEAAAPEPTTPTRTPETGTTEQPNSETGTTEQSNSNTITPPATPGPATNENTASSEPTIETTNESTAVVPEETQTAASPPQTDAQTAQASQAAVETLLQQAQEAIQDGLAQADPNDAEQTGAVFGQARAILEQVKQLIEAQNPNGEYDPNQARIDSVYLATANIFAGHIRVGMDRSKGKVAEGQRETPTYLEALSLEARGNQFFGAGMYEKAAVLYDQARIQFDRAASETAGEDTVSSEAKEAINTYVQTLKASLEQEDSGGLAALSFRDRDWSAFFATASAISADIRPGPAQATDNNVTLRVAVTLNYQNAQGQAQQQKLNYLWLLQDMGGWLLTRVSLQD